MILLIGSEKGGCGKTTLAINIAALLSAQGGDVLLVDADRQASASEWASERHLNQLDKPKITCVQCFGEIDTNLLDLSKRYQHIIIDVTGRDSSELRSSLLVADSILVPIKPATFDLSTLPTMIKIIQQSRRINPKLNAYAVLSIAPTNAKLKEIEQSRSVILDYSDSIDLLDTIIFDRKCYRDSTSDGIGVTEMLGKSENIKARNEMLNLAAEVFQNGN
jgi:chromosome partitioning protein